jgi:hypothetical protein
MDAHANAKGAAYLEAMYTRAQGRCGPVKVVTAGG